MHIALCTCRIDDCKLAMVLNATPCCLLCLPCCAPYLILYRAAHCTCRIDEYKLAMVSNLTLCCYHQADYVQAVAYASKGLEHNPDSAKLLLRRARALSMKVRGCVARGAAIGRRGARRAAVAAVFSHFVVCEVRASTCPCCRLLLPIRVSHTEHCLDLMRVVSCIKQQYLAQCACCLQGNYDEAEEDLKTCQGLVQSKSEADALAQEVEQELVANRRRAKAAETKQKKTFANFFDR